METELPIRAADRLFELLTAYRAAGVFNQYRDIHPELDRPYGAAVRCRNLRRYLEAFASARFLLVGEAAGYAGCRFSGIPFTCEAQLVGPQRLPWALDKDLASSSAAERPWVERSATIVWEALGKRRDCMLWNAFPWHPFDGADPLSNRPPGRDLYDGLEVLRCLLSLFPSARPYAVGRVAQRALEAIGVRAPYIRHPSHGGKRRFAEAVAGLESA
ncbi:MAG TPA: hypothetical protein ENI39_07670 [Anaerolineae bacterium]|nr:hypothetical protein [Anaerolineae bacterium]